MLRPFIILLLLAWLTATGAAMAAEARIVIPLAEGWRFRQDDALRGAEAPGFADAGWAGVRVPHTWNRVGAYRTAGPHLNTAANLDKTQGVGWYRLTFIAPASAAGKRAWLQFDAASRTAEVWLNGIRLGEHRGGFSRFRLDATAALKPGARNVLAVRTDNTAPAPGSSTADVLPLAGDFFVHGGLYRPVSLVLTDPVHIDMLDFGGPGVSAATTSVRGRRAEVAVRSRLRNEGARPVEVVVETRLRAANGKVAAVATRSATLPAQGGAEVSQALVLADAHLWQGVADPYLYRLEVELRAGGRRLDALNQAFGVRTIRIDPDRGLILNGRPVRLHGVGYHQDREGEGWATDRSDVAADVAIMREMGVNTIRLTHYQHGQAIHDLADRYGLILWDEIPLVSVWTLGSETRASPALVANARQQLQELIRQNGNHPSVAVWSIANEVDFGNSLPGFLTGSRRGAAPDPLPLLRELDALAKVEDPSRPTTLATCCEGRLFAPGVDVPNTAAATDVAGANRYFGWYFGKADDLGPHLDQLHARRPRQPLAVTEYGAGGAITLHTDDPLGGPPDSRGRQQPEEYMAYVHERNWAALAARPYLWATWLWNSFDFATTIRHEGDADDINTKGLVTYDRAVRKDPYYFYRANWTATPTVHITGRRYVERAYAVTDVRVYSNAPATELFVGGRSFGVRRTCRMQVCVWRDAALSAGENRIEARGRFGRSVVRDQVAWRLAAEHARAFRIDSGALVSGAPGRFGSDAFFEGGEARTMDRPADYGQARAEASVTGAGDPAVAASYREGDFRYRIPVGPGRYTVTLTFAEPGAKPGERAFDVIADGRAVLTALDVAQAASGASKALVRSFDVEATDAGLDLRFRPLKGLAMVSSVEVAPR